MSNQENSNQNDNSIKPSFLFKHDEKTKKAKPTPAFWAVLGAFVLIVSLFGLTYKNAQEIYIGGTKVATISGTKLTEKELTETTLAKIKGEEGVNIQLEEDIALKTVRASKKDLVSLDYALYKIGKVFNYSTEGAVINVDGKDIVTLESTQAAENVLQQIKNKYLTQDSSLINVEFIQNVKVEPKFVNEEEISTEQVAIDLLTASTNQEKKYQIKEGDTLYQIAIDHGIALNELFKANPSITEDTVLKIGQEIDLIVPIPLVSVKTTQKVTYNESIERKTETTYNDSQYKTYRKVIKEGADGEKTVIANVIKVNGYETGRNVISEKVILEPVAQTVEVGTLNTPPKAAIGNFIYPVLSKVSSGYGYRDGGVHKGIDLTAPNGTPVVASDGGTVTYSGWYGGYGNLVKIDHGNGFVTLYGHNSRNNVSVGQKVAQGEVIAYVGSTGDSTGNHVHLEIIKNGVTQNPLNYLK